MTDIFTMSSKEAIESANKIAKKFNADYVGTEHLLYGLLDISKRIGLWNVK